MFQTEALKELLKEDVKRRKSGTNSCGVGTLGWALAQMWKIKKCVQNRLQERWRRMVCTKSFLWMAPHGRMVYSLLSKIKERNRSRCWRHGGELG